jgi:hypothetical protein
MWTTFINTLTGFTKLAPRHIKSWSPFVFQAGVVFFVIGTLTGMLACQALLFFAVDYYELLENVRAQWLAYSIQSGANTTLIGWGMVAAAFSRRSEAPVSFGQFSRETPRAAWQAFIVCTLLTAVLSAAELYLMQYVLNWFRYMLNVLNFASTGLFAGAVFIKAAGGPRISLYRSNLALLMVIGMVFRLLINGVYYQVYLLVVSPVITFLATPDLITTFSLILIPSLMITSSVFLFRNLWVWTVCGSFYEEEAEFELETETKTYIHQ